MSALVKKIREAVGGHGVEARIQKQYLGVGRSGGIALAYDRDVVLDLGDYLFDIIRKRVGILLFCFVFRSFGKLFCYLLPREHPLKRHHR